MSKRTVIIAASVWIAALLGAAVYVFVFKADTSRDPGPPKPGAKLLPGTVIDAVDTPLSGVTVRVDGRSTKPAISSDEGSVDLPPLRDGTHIVELSSADVEAHHSIVVKNGGLISIDGRPGTDLLLSLPLFARDYRRIPAVDPATDVVTDKDGSRIVRDTLEIIWKQGVSAEKRRELLGEAPGFSIRGEIDELRLTEVGVPPGTLEQLLPMFRDIPEIEAVTKAYVVDPSLKPKDPDYAEEAKSWWLRKIEAEQAWDISSGSPEMTVAVIDAGFQLDHPQLRSAFLPGMTLNYTSEDVGAAPDHGTHVSGIIAMKPDTSGLVGIASGARIMPMKVSTVAHEADAILLASRTKGAWVINMSMAIDWGQANQARQAQGQPAYTDAEMASLSGEHDRILVPAVEIARKRDVVMVHAAGNNNLPAKWSGLDSAAMVTVGSSGPTDGRSAFSNHGDLITLFAPGERVWSSVGGDGLRFMSGTSMASPLVAGVIADVRTANPALSVDRVKALMVETADPAPGGLRRLNAWQALLAATNQYGVKGKVVDDVTGREVAGATVYPSGLRRAAVKTEADGSFVISAIPRDERIPVKSRWRLVVENGGRKQSLKLSPLPKDKWVARDVVLRLGAPKQSGGQAQLQLIGELNLDCTFNSPLTGQPKTAHDPLRFRFWGPISATSGSFTGTQEASSLQNQRSDHIDDIVFSGSIDSLEAGGKAVLDIRAIQHHVIAFEKYSHDQPVHIVIDGEVVRRFDPGSGEFKSISVLKATSIKVEPYPMYLGFDNDTKKKVWTDCSYTFDPSLEPIDEVSGFLIRIRK